MTTNKYPCYFEGQEKKPQKISGYEKLYSDIACYVLRRKGVYGKKRNNEDEFYHSKIHDEEIDYYSTIRRNGDDVEDEYLVKSRIDFCINNFLTDDQATAITLLYGLYQDDYSTRIGFNSLDKYIKGPIDGYLYNKENNNFDYARNLKSDSIIILSEHINDIRYGPRYRDMKNIENDIRKETDVMFYYFDIFKDTSDYLGDYKNIYLEDTTLGKKEVAVLYRSGINNIGKLIEVTKADGLECVKKTKGYNDINFSKLISFANDVVELDNYLSSIDEGVKEIKQNVYKESEATT